MIGFHCFGLFGLVGTQTAQHLVPVHAVSIKLRSIDTDELGLAAHRHTARTAHSRAVHHNGVERCLGGDIILGSGQRYEFHHYRRTDRDTFVDGLAVDHFLYAHGHHTLFAHRTVVGHHNQFVRPLCQFVLQDNQVFVAGSQHGYHAVTGFLERFGDRQHRRSAHSSAGTHHGAVVLNTRSFSQGTYHVVDRITGIECQQFVRRNAYLLNHQRDRSFLRICARYSKRHSLRTVVHTDDHEMAGTTTTRNERSLNNKLRYIFREKSLRKNLIHKIDVRFWHWPWRWPWH